MSVLGTKLPRQFRILRIALILQLLLGLYGETAAQLNQGSYPDWATRWPADEQYDRDCGPLWNQSQYGPFDYRLTKAGDRELVEGAHFTYEYSAYLKGDKVSARPNIRLPPASGFSYTLWAFPNQPQALAAMEDLGIRHKTEKPPGAKMRVHCYFQRAVRYTPDDPDVRAIYGYYYARRGNANAAKIQFEKANEFDIGKSTTSVYQAFGYIEIKEFEKALEAAKMAYSRGYSLPGLKYRLEKAGKWKD